MCLRLSVSTKKPNLQCYGSQNESVMVKVIFNVFHGLLDISALSNPLLYFGYVVPRLKRTQFHGQNLENSLKKANFYSSSYTRLIKSAERYCPIISRIEL